MRSSIPGICLVVCTVLAVMPARAADPQSYRVDLASTGDGSMDAALSATSELLALRGTAPVGPFGLVARARGDVDRLKTVLESYGYYQSAVTIKIEGLVLGSGEIADALTALPKGRDAHVGVSFALGPLYHLRKVTLDGTLPPSAQSAFVLKPGEPAVASEVLGAGSRLLAALQEQGYAFATVDSPVAYEDQTEPLLDVSFHVVAGAQVDIGQIRLEGLQRVHEKFVRHRLTLHTGQRYSSSAIEAARRDLLNLGPFGTISVEVGKKVDSTGGVPVTFVMHERKRHAVTVNGGYSSDLGGSGGVTWTDRNVFGNAETLNVSASVINLGGSDTTGVGYDTSAKLLFPDFGHRDQSLQFAVGAIKQYLEAYDQNAVTSSVTLSRKLSSVWSASAGVAASKERILQNNVNYDYTLLALPLAVNYDSTHLASPLDDPTHGMRNSLGVTPTRSLGHPSATFIITQIKLAAYVDLHAFGFTDPGRSVLAVRALAGEAQGAGELSLPPDQRFYGGGSATIRGYGYQLVGPQFCTVVNSHPAPGAPAATNQLPVPGMSCTPSGIPIGGTAIVAGSIEFRQRFGANWGAAFFVDGGQVSGSLKPLPSEVDVGVGAGVRYYTALGPIRLDVAVPTKSVGGDSSFQVYIGLGQAF